MKLGLILRKMFRLRKKLPEPIQRYTPEQLKEKKKLYGDRIKQDKQRLVDLDDRGSDYYKEKVNKSTGIGDIRKRLQNKINLFQNKIDNDFSLT